MPEAVAGGQGHDLLKPRFGPFYAQAVNGATFRHCIAATGARMRVPMGSIVPSGPELPVSATGIG